MKRRLQLMPEVLPAPNKTATSAVRERTMARLRVLAAVGAGIAAACGGATTGSSGDGKGSSGGGGGGPDGGLPDANKPDSDPGYGVVDPLPAPACFDYATQPTATAKFVDPKDVGVDGKADAGSGRWVQVIITLNQKDVAVGDIKAQGDNDISIVKQDLEAGEIDLVLFQAPTSTNFQTSIQIQTSCAKGPTRVIVSINEGPAGKVEASVSYYGE
jgi:hypothetical protein